jgi:hypothetical protein
MDRPGSGFVLYSALVLAMFNFWALLLASWLYNIHPHVNTVVSLREIFTHIYHVFISLRSFTYGRLDVSYCCRADIYMHML